MFELSVPSANQPALLSGLKKLPGVTLNEKAKAGTFSHRSGLELSFTFRGDKVQVVIGKNPENVPEDKIRERLTDDVDTIVRLAS
jgi:hypothetical protein